MSKDFGAFYREADVYASRRKSNKPKYQPMLELLLRFAQDRADGAHTLSVAYFVDTILPKYVKEHDLEIATDLSVTACVKWLADEHPELREEFRR